MTLHELKVKATKELGADTSDLSSRAHRKSFKGKEQFFAFDSAYVSQNETDSELYNLGVIEVDENKNWKFNFSKVIPTGVEIRLSPEEIYTWLREIKNL